jgi:DNA-binding response OmpR family regulator
VKILVVEDQDAIRRMIEALVRARGFEVTAVNTGTKALDVMATAPPDVVLLDLMLPGHDGFEVCRRLRDDPSTRPIPVIIISALDDEDSRRKATEVGANAYFTKPFSPIALLAELERIRSRTATA